VDEVDHLTSAICDFLFSGKKLLSLGRFFAGEGLRSSSSTVHRCGEANLASFGKSWCLNYSA